MPALAVGASAGPPGGRRGNEFFEAGADGTPKAFAVEDAHGDVECELREKTNQDIFGTWRDCPGQRRQRALTVSGGVP